MGFVERISSPSTNGVVLLVFVLVAVHVGLAPLQDNSFLTHLATGRLILEGGAVPSADPYSWTAKGQDWTVQSWLASVVYAGAEDVGGLRAIRILSACLVMILTLLLWRLTEVARGMLGRALAMALPMIIGTMMWTERPYMFGAVGLALVLLSVEGRLDPRLLVPVMWVWANTHGSFPFALVLLALMAVGRALDERRRPDLELRCLGWVALGTALSVVGPLGLRSLTFPVQLLSNQEAFAYIEEWQRLDPSTPAGMVFLVQLLAALFALARVRQWRWTLPTIGFALGAIMSTRNILQASIVLAPVVAVGFGDLGQIQGDRRPRLAGPIAHALIVVVVFFGVARLQAADSALEPYPQDALSWMHENGLLGLETRVVARELVGNYIEFAYGPDKALVFIDDRVDMFPADVREHYVSILEGEQLEAVLEELEPTAVLWDKESSMGRWLAGSDAWSIVWEDEVWLVVVPSD